MLCLILACERFSFDKSCFADLVIFRGFNVTSPDLSMGIGSHGIGQLSPTQGSYAILKINFQTFQDLFQTFFGLFPDLTFTYDLPRSSTGTAIFNAM